MSATSKPLNVIYMLLEFFASFMQTLILQLRTTFFQSYQKNIVGKRFSHGCEKRQKPSYIRSLVLLRIHELQQI